MIFKPSLSVYQDMKKVLLQADYRNRRGWFQSYDCGLGWNGFSERRTEEEDAVRDASRARGRLGDELEEEEEEEPQQGTVLQKPLKDPSIYTRRRGRHEEDSKQPYIHDFHQPECGYMRYLSTEYCLIYNDTQTYHCTATMCVLGLAVSCSMVFFTTTSIFTASPCYTLTGLCGSSVAYDSYFRPI